MSDRVSAGQGETAEQAGAKAALKRIHYWLTEINMENVTLTDGLAEIESVVYGWERDSMLDRVSERLDRLEPGRRSLNTRIVTRDSSDRWECVHNVSLQKPCASCLERDRYAERQRP